MFIFLYGQNTLFIKEKLTQLKEKFLAEIDKTGFNLTELSADNLELGAISQAISAIPFLAKKRMVIINNIFDNDKKEFYQELTELLKKQKFDDVIVIFLQNSDLKKIKETNSLLKFLLKCDYQQEFPPLSNLALVKWVKNEIKNYQTEIDAKAINLLLSLVGNDLISLKLEINKLANYKPKGIINSKDIDDLIVGVFNDSIFLLIEAIANHNKSLAFEILQKQRILGTSETQILSLLARQFRMMIIGQDMVSQNMNDREISKELKLHPYIFSKIKRQFSLYSPEKLKVFYQIFLKIDQKIKSGIATPDSMLDLFIASS